MKIFLFLMPLLAHASGDSLAVIVRPEKALVQVQEPGSAARLRSFIQALSSEEHFLLTSADNSLKLECGITAAAAGCVIRILPGDRARIEGKRVSASVPIAELGAAGDARPLEANFLSSNGDQLAIHLRDGVLSLEGSKR